MYSILNNFLIDNMLNFLDVGRTCYPNYTDDIVQKTVTGWLRHSTDRLQSLIQKQLENNIV